MSRIQKNKEAIRRLVEEVYGGDLDHLENFVAEDYRDHSRWSDREGLRKVLSAFKTAYPDVRFTVMDLLAEGNEVAARFACDCGGHDTTHRKHFDAIAIFRLADGRVVEHWAHSDSFF